MAYIIRDDHSYTLGKTDVEFLGDDLKTLHAFFDRTDAYPGTIIRATWVSGTYIPPDVMPRRLRLIRGRLVYDWLVVRGGATLVSARFKDAVEELDPGRHQFFPVVVENEAASAPFGDLFVFNVVGRIDSIIEGRSSFRTSGRGKVETGATKLPDHGNVRWMLRSSATGPAGSSITTASAGSSLTGWRTCCRSASSTGSG
jgi:hypothetical protein